MLNSLKNNLVNKFSNLSTVDKIKIGLGVCIPVAHFNKYVITPQIQHGISSVFSLLNPFRFYTPHFEFAKYLLNGGLTSGVSFTAIKLTEGFEEADLQTRRDGIPNRDNKMWFALAKAGALLPAAAAITSAHPPLFCSALVFKGLLDLGTGKNQSSKTLGIAEMGSGLFTLFLGSTICEAGFTYLYALGPVIAGLSIVAAEILSSFHTGAYKEKIENHINSIPDDFMDNPPVIARISRETNANLNLVKDTLCFQHNMFAGNAHIDNLGAVAKTLNSAVASALFCKMIGFNPAPEKLREYAALFTNNAVFNQNHISDEQLKLLNNSVKKGIVPMLDGVSEQEMTVIRENFTLARASILTNREEAARERAL